MSRQRKLNQRQKAAADVRVATIRAADSVRAVAEPEEGETKDDFMARCQDEGGSETECEMAWGDMEARRSGGVQGAAVRLNISGAGEPLTIQAAEGDGRGPTFAGTVYTGGAMRLEGFYTPVVVDLASFRVPRQQNPALRDHDPKQIIGHTTEVEVTAKRLRVKGVISGEGAHAQEVLALGKKAFPWQMSLGADADKVDTVPAGEKVTVNGRVFTGPVSVARGGTFREASFVALGADGMTAATVAAQHSAGGNPMTFETWLSAKGIDPAGLTDQMRSVADLAYRAEQVPANPRPAGGAKHQADVTALGRVGPNAGRNAARTMEESMAELRAEEAREQEIVRVINAACKYDQNGFRAISPDAAEILGRQAMEQRWSLERLELEILKEGRARPHSFNRGTQAVPDESVIEAAVCLAGNIPNPEKYLAPQALEASRRHWKNGLSLGELMMTFARKGGYTGHSIRGNERNVLQAAFRPDLQASGWGPSTSSGLSGVLSNVANKFLRSAFDAVDQTWQQIAATRSVNDFKAITTYSLTGDFQYLELPPGGEIKHAELGAESYSNQVKTYARMIGIDRRDLINDDLGALTGVGRRLGRGGALKINDVFWTVFLNNSAFFTSGRANVSTGGGSALSVAGLDAAYAKFLTQTDPNGKPAGITPAILLVPPALWGTAKALMQSTGLNQTPASNAAGPEANIWAGMFTVASSPYMQSSTYTGNSSAAWYLLANPNDVPVIEVAFLNGQMTPVVESADADFNQLGIAFRAYHDMGASLQEYRGGVRSAGS